MNTVLFLTSRLGVGGAEMMWAEIIGRLDRTRFRPVLCCLYEPGLLGSRLQENGITVHSGLVRHRWDLRVFPRLLRLLRRERVELLYMINQPLAQFWGSLCGKMAGTRALATAIHSTGKISRVRRRLWANRLTFAWVDKVTALSEAHKSYLIEREGIDPEKIEIIPNGIEAARFMSPGPREESRKRLGVLNGAPTVGIVAMLRPEKNHKVFLQAARRVLREVPEARFLIVGEGPERPGLESLAKDLGIETQVSFLGVREDIPELLNAMDVAVLSSHPVVETLSVSVLEYMAAGKPVVATRVGSLPELVEEARTGFLVEPGDAEGLAERILRLLKDPGLARYMGTMGRERVVCRYTVDQMVRSTEALFERLLVQEEVPACV